MPLSRCRLGVPQGILRERSNSVACDKLHSYRDLLLPLAEIAIDTVGTVREDDLVDRNGTCHPYGLVQECVSLTLILLMRIYE